MNHEAFREQLALSLYGELDTQEAAELARHLAACAECRRFADELGAGLGRVAAARRTTLEHELPRDWRERLDLAWKETSPRRSSPTLSTWWAAAAGLAAGLLIAWATFARVPERSALPIVQQGASSDTTADGTAHAATAYARFKRAAAPPLASTSDQLARMTRYLKR
jgi:anti-sigma factor RsiW